MTYINFMKFTAFVSVLPILYSSEAIAKNRCEADLSRVKPSFCLANVPPGSASQPLTYQWKLNDQLFDLTSNVCIPGAPFGARRDLILALDRSQSIWGPDTGNKKLGADQISTALYIIDKLHAEAIATPEIAPKVSLVLFSSAPDCRAYQGGPIDVNREFPCVFAPGHSIAEPDHVQLLKDMLNAAEHQYSQGGLSRSSDYGIVANLIANDVLGMASPTGASMVLFSDGRSYRGADGDVFAYLRSESYVNAQGATLAAFANPPVQNVKTVFALSPLKAPVFDAFHIGPYSNMCGLPSASAVDCDPANVALQNPLTWPVNKLDVVSFATQLVAQSGGTPEQVVSLMKREEIDRGLESFRVATPGLAVIDAVAYSINGGGRLPGIVAGNRIHLENLPAEPSYGLNVILSSGGVEFDVPMSLALQNVPYEGGELLDKEMVCVAGPDTVTEQPDRYKLQGGAASCGVVNFTGKDGDSKLAILVLSAPLLLVLIYRFLSSSMLLVLLVSMSVALAASQRAEAEPAKGLNVLQYRPVVDGVGSTEKAIVIPPGSYNAGLFLDYANDPVEIGGDKNKRVESVMDNLVTAHAAFNLGIYDGVALGAHIPFVHRSDVERYIDGEAVKAGQIGEPSDAAIMVKFNLLSEQSYALGLMPMATLPTGKPELLIGDESANFGALLLASGDVDAFSWATAIGYLQRDKPLELFDDRAEPVSVRGQGILQGGVEYKLSSWMSLGGNLQLKPSAGEGLNLEENSPAEWSGSGKVRPLPYLEIQGGFGTGLGKGIGAPDYRIFAGVSYIPASSSMREYRPATSVPRAHRTVPNAVRAAGRR